MYAISGRSQNMKNMRKLLVLLLAVSLALCATAVMAFADGDETVVTDAEIESLVELYKSGIYYAEDYEDDTSISSDSGINDNSGIAEIVTDSEGNNLLKITGKASANDDVSIVANLASGISGFVYSGDIFADGGIFNIYVSGSDENETFENIPLVSLNFSEGAVYIQTAGAYGMPVMQKLSDVSIGSGVWYNVTALYDASENSCTLVIEQAADSEEDATVCSLSFDTVFKAVTGAKVSVAGATIANKTLYFDNVYFYEGSEVKDLALAEASIGPVVSKIVEKIGAADDEETALLVDMLNLLIQERNFKADAYEDVIKYANLLIAEKYIYDYVDLVYSYNSGDLYAEKVARVEKMMAIRDMIPEIPEYDETEEQYEKMQVAKSAKLKADTEYLMITISLDKLKRESEKFIRFMYDKDSRNNRYSDIKSWLDVAGTYEFDPTFELPVEVVIKETVNGVEVERTEIHYMDVSLEKYLHLITKEQLVREASITYMDYVTVMIDENVSFEERYDAYSKAAAIRFIDAENTFSYVKKFVNEDGETVEETVYLQTYVDAYNVVYKEILDIEKVCRNFISAVADAKNAIDINNLNIALAKAEKYDMTGENDDKIKIEFSYPGVSEAILDYNMLCEKKVTEQNQANEFIAAVELIKAANDNDSLKAAIAAARAILPHGILTGYEGYSEALSYFSSVESSLIYNESYANRFIEIVNSLNSIPMGKEKYDAIAEANDCYAHITDEVEGVAAAKAVLAAAIQMYDAEMSAENASFEKAVSKSVMIASAVAPSNAFLRLVAIVKKMFE